ncbi:MAG: N-acetylmuramoyl-L-alanine amidase [Candidatus Omnitrophica bacterium]|nr:N-acetylmuramoyl-L-alanine amidase [Candidatus Omnitrophota bacterium]
MRRRAEGFLKKVFFFLLVAFFIPGCAHAPSRSAFLPLARPVSSQATPVYHVVQRGETFYRIAKLYGMSAGDLMAANRASDPATLEVGQRLLIPRPGLSEFFAPSTARPLPLEEVRTLVGPARHDYGWQTITVHHSGTLKGSARNFHRDHLRRGMGGLFYHFVIGNGSYSGDGQIEVGWRWKKQLKANRPHDIQICLVGDFNRQVPTEAEFGSLVNLVAVLRREYGISLDDIRRHEDIKGKHTECPGEHFPFLKLLSTLDDIEKNNPRR